MSATDEYDYVIVGAGSAGCVLAARLSEDPATSVLLLEAGGWDRSPYIAMPLAWGRMFANRAYDWMYDSQPEPQLDGRVLDCARGRVIGGSSSINAMAFGRGHREDYDNWANMGLEGWSYNEVLPFFKKCETWENGGNDFRGGEGPLKIVESPVDDPIVEAWFDAARDMQLPFTHDTNGEIQEGFGVPQFSISKGRRCSTSFAYLRPALKRKNLTVITNAVTDHVTFEGTIATGVSYIRNGSTNHVTASKEVILSTGSIHTPQVLIRSGVGASDELAELGIETVLDLPGVGKNLHDHMSVGLDFERKDSGALHQRLRYDRFIPMVAQGLLFGKGMATGLPMGALAFLKSDYADQACDLTLLFRASSIAPAQYWPWQKPKPDGVGYRVAILNPDSRGHIKVVSKDPEAHPEIYNNLLATPRDWDIARQAVRLMLRFNNHPMVNKFIASGNNNAPLGDSDAEVDAHIRKTANTVHHPVGTCKMGIESDPMAVVDAKLRVRGLSKLRIVDASIMPKIITGPTNGPTIMIAEKAADFISAA